MKPPVTRIPTVAGQKPERHRITTLNSSASAAEARFLPLTYGDPKQVSGDWTNDQTITADLALFRVRPFHKDPSHHLFHGPVEDPGMQTYLQRVQQCSSGFPNAYRFLAGTPSVGRLIGFTNGFPLNAAVIGASSSGGCCHEIAELLLNALATGNMDAIDMKCGLNISTRIEPEIRAIRPLLSKCLVTVECKASCGKPFEYDGRTYVPGGATQQKDVVDRASGRVTGYIASICVAQTNTEWTQCCHTAAHELIHARRWCEQRYSGGTCEECVREEWEAYTNESACHPWGSVKSDPGETYDQCMIRRVCGQCQGRCEAGACEKVMEEILKRD